MRENNFKYDYVFDWEYKLKTLKDYKKLTKQKSKKLSSENPPKMP